MKFSIITPVHESSAKYLEEAYVSLSEQTEEDWEWVLVTNRGGDVPSLIVDDPRVYVYSTHDDEGDYNSIGRLKNFASSKAHGDVLVELDADDILTPDALSCLADAFSDPNIVMAYSNSAMFKDGTWEASEYGSYWGWRSRDFEYNGHKLREMIAFEPMAASFRRIEWAPNHVRAWRSTAYWKILGHDSGIFMGDDHDLCCRMFIEYGPSAIKHIDKCLYLYRLHENSSRVFNKVVQDQVQVNYNKYSRDLAIREADDRQLLKLDLGGQFDAWDGFKSVDKINADILTDLDDPWPFVDDSVGVLRASHIFEHLKDPIHVMNEAYRVLAPGGWLFVDVPSTDGRGAFQDPTHVSFWNENSFWYYTNRFYSKYLGDKYTGRFQVSRMLTWFPSKFEKEHDISVVQADLIALKEPYSDRPPGEVLI